jgi:hypothetical protein
MLCDKRAFIARTKGYRTDSEGIRKNEMPNCFLRVYSPFLRVSGGVEDIDASKKRGCQIP